MLEKAEAMGEHANLLLAHLAFGHSFFHIGQLQDAKEQFEVALSLYDSKRPPIAMAVDWHVNILSYLCWISWWLGFSDQSLKYADRAVAVASELAHPHSMAFTYAYAAVMRMQRIDPTEALALAEKLIPLCTEYGLQDFLAVGRGIKGWVLATQGSDEGIELIEQWIESGRVTGLKMSRPCWLNVLAEAYMRFERSDAASRALDEALQIAEQCEVRYCEAETYRLKGELLLKHGESDADGAFKCFERAIAVAQKQSAKSFELRTTTSIVRLLAGEGRRDEAHKHNRRNRRAEP
jgi:tetratricopeptide (TPR) repeat protein